LLAFHVWLFCKRAIQKESAFAKEPISGGNTELFCGCWAVLLSDIGLFCLHVWLFCKRAIQKEGAFAKEPIFGGYTGFFCGYMVHFSAYSGVM